MGKENDTRERDWKRIRLILGISGSLSLLSFGGVCAFYGRQFLTENRLQTAEPAMAIDDAFQPVFTWLPGEEKQREVWMQNTGDMDLLLRIRPEQVWETAETGKSEQTGMDACEADGRAAIHWSASVQDGTQWFRGEDGYLYYNKIFRAHETTGKIMESITFCQQLSNDGHEPDYAGAVYTLKVTGETGPISAPLGWSYAPVIRGNEVIWEPAP